MKKLLLGLMLMVLLFGSFFLNIFIHEYGHYTVADYYELNPTVHFDSTAPADSKFALYLPDAFTSYSSSGEVLTKQDATIAFAGPLVNLIFALSVCGIYVCLPRKRKTVKMQMCFAMLAIPAFLSFIVNLLPIGFSDGAIILSALGI
ncbi:hypothetical protein GF374_00515 [Candidatus Woesearchaeota archaeon]|nr:hypothetical protein [Candidatus Woesearchaeota archaeon]